MSFAMIFSGRGACELLPLRRFRSFITLAVTGSISGPTPCKAMIESSWRMNTKCLAGRLKFRAVASSLSALPFSALQVIPGKGATK
jgi:hypothetical protein